MTNNDLDLGFPVKPEVQLTGQDGNAFNIMGLCCNELKKALREMKYKQPEIDDMTSKLLKAMQAGDYNHLLQVAMFNFEVD